MHQNPWRLPRHHLLTENVPGARHYWKDDGHLGHKCKVLRKGCLTMPGKKLTSLRNKSSWAVELITGRSFSFCFPQLLRKWKGHFRVSVLKWRLILKIIMVPFSSKTNCDFVKQFGLFVIFPVGFPHMLSKSSLSNRSRKSQIHASSIKGSSLCHYKCRVIPTRG